MTKREITNNMRTEDSVKVHRGDMLMIDGELCIIAQIEHVSSDDNQLLENLSINKDGLDLRTFIDILPFCGRASINYVEKVDITTESDYKEYGWEF